MTQLDLKVQCPELLQQMPGFPNDGTGTALQDIITEARTNQQDLRKLFGFSIDDDATIEEEIKDFEKSKYYWSTEVILALLDEEQEKEVRANPQELVTNTLASGMKVSKAIAKRVVTNDHVKKLIQWLSSLDSSEREPLMETLHDELEKYNEYDIFDLCKNPMTFVQNFFSEMANTRNRYIGFTLEPLMFVRGCNSSSYTSCYKIDRWYNSNAPFTYARTGVTGMMYIRNNKEILGRCWVVVAPDFKSVIVLKAYGFLTRDTQERLLRWVCAGLNPSAEWKMTGSSIGASLAASFSNTGVYNDPIAIVASSINGIVNVGVSVPQGKCLFCGSVLDMDSSTCVCNKCQEERLTNCANCGTKMIKDFNHKVQLCPKCLSTKTVCPKCGQILNKGETCSCEHEDELCTFCGDKKAITINGVSLCEDCARSMCKTTCDICGRHGVMYPMKKLALCQPCFVQAQLPENSVVSTREIRERIRNLVGGEQND